MCKIQKLSQESVHTHFITRQVSLLEYIFSAMFLGPQTKAACMFETVS